MSDSQQYAWDMSMTYIEEDNVVFLALKVFNSGHIIHWIASHLIAEKKTQLKIIRQQKHKHKYLIHIWQNLKWYCIESVMSL